jgi:pyruvate/2-oxoglutarate dehydrogenase complex dihydrolipoamide dehydrogenase (E3) component
MNEHYEVMIVGGGKAGKTLAVDYAKAGKKVAMIEQGFIGGTCINVGCIPTKALIASSNMLHTLDNLIQQDLVKIPEYQVNWQQIRQRKDNIVANMIEMNHKLFVNSGMDFILGMAKFINEKTVEVTLTEQQTKAIISADTVIINTGAKPFVPPISGLAQVPYHTSESILNLEQLPKQLIIIGGGYIGLEFGQMFSRLGSKVTIIERSQTFIPLEDRDIASMIFDTLTAEGIEIILGSENIHLENHAGKISLSTTILGESTPRTIEGDTLLVAIGREPNTKDLGLANAGVNVDERGFVKVDEYLQTNVPHIWAVGDVKGGAQFTHLSFDDYRILKHNLAHPDNKRSITARQIPYTVFIDPELGRIGLNETQAEKLGLAVKTVQLPVAAIPRAKTLGLTQGLIKVCIDLKTDQILGASVLCENGGEIMGAVQIAMLGKLSYMALRDAMFAHPTLIEGFNQVFSV